jgi:hypothetical protein
MHVDISYLLLLHAAAAAAAAALLYCSLPYLAAVCSQVLCDNGYPHTSHSVICTPSPSTLKIGPKSDTDVPNICNCLVADLLDDGVLSAGLIPAVSNALEDLLVRDQPVIVPQRLTVMAQAVGVRPAVVEVQGLWEAGSSGGGCAGSSSGTCRLDLTALDAYRCVSLCPASTDRVGPCCAVPLDVNASSLTQPISLSSGQTCRFELTSCCFEAVTAPWR